MYSLIEQPNVPLNPEWKSKSLRRSATFPERLESLYSSKGNYGSFTERYFIASRNRDVLTISASKRRGNHHFLSKFVIHRFLMRNAINIISSYSRESHYISC